MACLELLRNALLGGWAWRQGRFDMGDHDGEPVQRRVRVLRLDELRQVAQFLQQPPSLKSSCGAGCPFILGAARR